MIWIKDCDIEKFILENEIPLGEKRKLLHERKAREYFEGLVNSKLKSG